jgi:hypothetical protein
VIQQRWANLYDKELATCHCSWDRWQQAKS